MNFIIIYITHPNMKIAKEVVAVLMEKRLVACGNFFPIENTFWWEGEIQNSNEVVSIVKTRKDNWEKVKAEVLKIHPYEVPCIMKIEVEANEGYVDWINKETE